MIRYVILLRGINVGGKNKIPMAALKSWVIVDGIPPFIDFLSAVFDAKEIIRMLAADGVRVGHAEVRIHCNAQNVG